LHERRLATLVGTIRTGYLSEDTMDVRVDIHMAVERALYDE
jgi:hypothetical protein